MIILTNILATHLQKCMSEFVSSDAAVFGWKIRDRNPRIPL